MKRVRNEQARAKQGLSHINGKYCYEGFLCNNPVHWAMGNGFIQIRHQADWALVRSGDGWRLAPGLWRGKAGDEPFPEVLEQALIARDPICYKALGVLAFTNPKYAEYKKLVRALYKEISGNDFPILTKK